MTALDQRRSEETETAILTHRLGVNGNRRPPIAMTILLVAHGLAHFVGVIAAFDALEAGRPLEYLGGSWMIGGDLLIGLVGMLWAILGLAFVFSAIAVFTEFRGWERSLILLGTLSTALCVLALWAAWIGIIVNAVIVIVALVSSNERLPGPPRVAV
ncbi:MAG: hypothetical protein PVF87_11775 [Acidimicrobiia bacterium]|jgi:hypothetical protein